jgi:hypothetical protein
MGLPEDLLEQAQHLVGRERTRPRQASLRRALSTAYYALFHLLISEATQLWKRPQDRTELARTFEHTHMKTVCDRTVHELNRKLKSTGTSGGPIEEVEIRRNLHFVAKTFLELHQERENADYNYSGVWTRSDAEAKVDAVASAFKAWETIRKEDIAQRFLFELLNKKRR